MPKLTTLLILILLSGSLIAQKIEIKGQVKDSIENINLSNAVIAVLNVKDSTYEQFTRSDKQGNFSITTIDTGRHILLISYPKYADFMDEFIFSAGKNIGTINLLPKAKLLDEVIVRTNNSIRIKGDTTEFVADSFKVRQGATVEELLKAMPGFTVNSKGEITAQGKNVDKVLVDGEEFFGNDPTIATQNIGAKAVDKVQMYDTKTASDDLKGIGAAGSSQGKTINIKLKEDAKKGHFGKIEAGSNFDKLTNASAMFNKFRGSQKLSFYGKKSSTDAGQLGWEEKRNLGIESDYEYDELNDYYISYSEGNEFSNWNLRGLPDAYIAGGQYANKWDEEKQNMNLSYTYNKLGTAGRSEKQSQTLLKDTTYFNNSNSLNGGSKQQHAGFGKYEWKLDSLATLKFTANQTYLKGYNNTTTYSEALNEEKEYVNRNNRINYADNTREKGTYQLNYKQLFKKKNRQLNTTLTYGITKNESTENLFSEASFYKNNIIDSTETIDQQKINSSLSKTMGAKLLFNEPLNDKWNLVTELSYNNNNSETHNNSYDKDVNDKYTEYNELFSNNFDLDATSLSSTVTARYMGKKLRAVFGSGISNIKLGLNNLDSKERTKFNFLNLSPQVQFNYMYKPQQNINISYRGNTVQPGLTQLQPLRNNTNPLYIYEGNPDLKVGFRHTINLGGNSRKTLKERMLWVNTSFSVTDNAITTLSTIDERGRTVSKPVNVSGNYNWYGYMNWWKTTQKKLNLNLSMDANGGRSINFMNGQRNRNEYANYTLRPSIGYYKENKFDFNIGPSVGYNISKSSLRPEADNNYWTYGGNVEGSVQLPGKFEIRTNADFTFRQKTPAFSNSFNTIIWNASLNKYFFKEKQLMIGLVANDILNQNIGFSRNINSNFISQERYDKIAQYFLLTAKWTFNKKPGN